MRSWLAGLAAVAMVAAAPAMAQEFSLKPGESVVVHVDAGKAIVVSRGPAQLNAYDRAVIAEAVKGSYADAPSDSAVTAKVNDDMPDPPEIAPGQIRYTLVTIPGDQRMLIIENGYGQALRYQARLHSNGRSGMANVCLVKPVRGTYEHWPFKVDSADILSISLSDWETGDPAPCQE
jgi:hypothetical protein